jgi:hypothetical protein
MPTCRLSDLTGRAVTTASGEPIGGLEDVAMCQRERGNPLMTGIVANTIDGRLRFGQDTIAHMPTMSTVPIVLRRNAVGAVDGPLANNEMLLRRDLLGCWFTELATADLVRACDLELAVTDEGWVLSAVYTHPPRWFGFGRRSSARELRGWNALASPRAESRRSHVDATRVAQRRCIRPLPASSASAFADLLESVAADAHADVAAAAAAITSFRRHPRPAPRTR